MGMGDPYAPASLTGGLGGGGNGGNYGGDYNNGNGGRYKRSTTDGIKLQDVQKSMLQAVLLNRHLQQIRTAH
jgi:hypothetical protein